MYPSFPSLKGAIPLLEPYPVISFIVKFSKELYLASPPILTPFTHSELLEELV